LAGVGSGVDGEISSQHAGVGWVDPHAGRSGGRLPAASGPDMSSTVLGLGRARGGAPAGAKGSATGTESLSVFPRSTSVATRLAITVRQAHTTPSKCQAPLGRERSTQPGVLPTNLESRAALHPCGSWKGGNP
jgi:hypothetical protein